MYSIICIYSLSGQLYRRVKWKASRLIERRELILSRAYIFRQSLLVLLIPEKLWAGVPQRTGAVVKVKDGHSKYRSGSCFSVLLHFVWGLLINKNYRWRYFWKYRFTFSAFSAQHFILLFKLSTKWLELRTHLCTCHVLYPSYNSHTFDQQWQPAVSVNDMTEIMVSPTVSPVTVLKCYHRANLYK